MFHTLGVHNIRRHGTWGNDVLPPPCWPSEREARIILLRHHELDPLLPVFFSSTIFSSLHSRQSVHSAHFLQHSVQCCAHRCWVPTVTPTFFWDFLMKTFWICVFPELFSLYVLPTLSSFSMHPLFHWHMLFIYLFLAATIFLLHTPLYVSFSYKFIQFSKKKKEKPKKKKKKESRCSTESYLLPRWVEKSTTLFCACRQDINKKVQAVFTVQSSGYPLSRLFFC